MTIPTLSSDRFAELEARVGRLESLADQLNREQRRPLPEAARLSGVPAGSLKEWALAGYLEHTVIAGKVKDAIDRCSKAHFTLKGRAA